MRAFSRVAIIGRSQASTTRTCSREQRGILIGVGFSALLALTGCGGGGGGGGPASTTVPVTYTYPSSLQTATSSDNVGGSIAPYALDPATTQQTSTLPTILGTSASAGNITITVASFALPPTAGGGTEPDFVVTFNPTAAGSSLLSNSPLDYPVGVGGVGGCADCLKTATASATPVGGGPAETVTFTYLDPNAASFPLKYSTLGMWAKPSSVSAGWEVGGPFSAGILTRGVDLPTTGTATYKGYMIGHYVTSDLAPKAGAYLVGANAQAVADFGAGAITSFSTTNTHISQLVSGTLQAPVTLNPPVAAPSLDFSTNTPMTINRTTSSFAGGSASGGTLTNTAGLGANWQMSGAFYGKPASTAPYAPPEMGGAFAATNTGNTKSMVGSFALKH